MPIYEYRCEQCQYALEKLQKMSDPELRECPACGQPALRKLVSAAGFQLKGNGWYATDFRGSKAGANAAPAAESAAPACAAPACATACAGGGS